MRLKLGSLLISLLAAVLPACKSGAPAARPPTAPALAFVQAYVGQQRILRYSGDEKKLSVQRKDLERFEGGCDVAVEIRQASFEGGTLRLLLDHLGSPGVEGPRARQSKACRAAKPQFPLNLSGFAGDAGADAVEAAVSRMLLTPEAYLAGHGITFDRPAAAVEGPVAVTVERGSTAEERSLTRKVTAWPRRLLWVDAAYYDPSRKITREGEVEFVAVVGADGRIHDPQVVTSLGSQHQELVKRVLPLWRFEPAHGKNEPVPARVSERLVLRIY